MEHRGDAISQFKHLFASTINRCYEVMSSRPNPITFNSIWKLAWNFLLAWMTWKSPQTWFRRDDTLSLTSQNRFLQIHLKRFRTIIASSRLNKQLTKLRQILTTNAEIIAIAIAVTSSPRKYFFVRSDGHIWHSFDDFLALLMKWLIDIVAPYVSKEDYYHYVNEGRKRISNNWSIWALRKHLQKLTSATNFGNGCKGVYIIYASVKKIVQDIISQTFLFKVKNALPVLWNHCCS